MEIKFITCKSGFWKILICKENGVIVKQYSGNTISDFEWVDLLNTLGHNVEYIKLPDDKIEKWQEEV